MKVKHTSGPWAAVPNGGDDTDPRAVLVAVRDQYGDWTVLADCRNRWLTDDVGGDEEANARLVAAAPDMLEALERIAKVGIHEIHDWRAVALRMQETALAAIAKATGEAP